MHIPSLFFLHLGKACGLLMDFRSSLYCHHHPMIETNKDIYVIYSEIVLRKVRMTLAKVPKNV